MLGHTRCYHKFIRGYVAITALKEKILKKYFVFVWSPECQGSFDMLKAKMTSAPILVFPDWNKEFHVHVDVSFVALGVVLVQPSEGDMDHLVAFSSRKLSFTERNYTTTKREGLEMVYALYKFMNYLLGDHFKMFIDHSTLKYLFNKHFLWGGIYVIGYFSSRSLILKLW